jgi:hypothetical protein
VIPNPNVELETQRVLGVVSRALDVFGGDVRPEQPTVFAADRALEDDLGRGHFGSAATSVTPGGAPAVGGSDPGHSLGGGVGDLDDRSGDHGGPGDRR